MSKAYQELIERQRQEINNFPVAYAFSQEQLKEALKKLGVESVKECTTVMGHGDIMKKEDAPKFVAMSVRHMDELKEAMKNKDFAYEAFLYEMDNHEYYINYDGDGDVLGCFGFEYEDLKEMDLELAYQLARKEHMRKAHEEWEII